MVRPTRPATTTPSSSRSTRGRIGTPALFDVEDDDVTPRRLVLEHVDRRADDVLWLRYRVEPGEGAR